MPPRIDDDHLQIEVAERFAQGIPFKRIAEELGLKTYRPATLLNRFWRDHAVANKDLFPEKQVVQCELYDGTPFTSVRVWAMYVSSRREIAGKIVKRLKNREPSMFRQLFPHRRSPS